MTGLINRHEFELTVEAQLEDAKTSRHQHALLFIDLDRFKIVNDTCGHKAGDQLLRQVTKLMLKKLRRTDLLGRLGGDEFGVLLENCQVEKAEEIAQTLINEIGLFRFHWDDKTFTIGASIGVVPINRDSRDSNSVFVAADSACYWAKEHDRNQAKVYRDDDAQLSDQRNQENWIERINQGLAHNRFRLYAQRITAPGHADGNGADCYEVLLRLQEGQQQAIPPMAFLPAAERHSLMPQIDRWVIQHTFELARRTRPVSNGSDRYLAINLSSVSLTDKTLLDFITEQSRLTGIAPQSICFEISEAAAIAQMEDARKLIAALRAMGCRIALDDFISGLSSFPYLKNHPVDYLKIDGQYIKAIDSDSLSYAMVDSINRMAHLLGIKTVAESVETTAVLGKLETIGVDRVQGYAVHRPQPVENLKL